MIVAYEPTRRVLASWALEFAECTAVIFYQLAGNEVRVIGSRSYMFESLGDVFASVKTVFPWKHIDLSIIPPDDDGVYAELFEGAGLECEPAPAVTPLSTITITRELFAVLSIDMSRRDWEPEENNILLIDSLNGYGAEPLRKAADTYAPNPAHSWYVYLTRALEHFAVWRHYGGQLGFGRRPDTSEYNRGVI